MKRLVCLLSFLILASCTPTYIVTFSASDGGSVSTIGGEFDEGAVVSVSATPAAEYEFVSWSDGSTQNPRTITVSETLNLTATFVKKQYDVSTNVIGKGTIKEEVLVQGGKYNSGTQLRLTAIPQEGWVFTSWSGAVNSEDNPIIVDVNAAKDIRVTFDKTNPLFLAENGVTIKAYDYAEVGDVWELDGEEYLIVDETMLRSMVANDEDVTNVVTSKVTDMNRLFQGKPDFNQSISSWDVSNVTNMEEMFAASIDGIGAFNQDISEWEVFNVVNMGGMFINSSFNGDISNWDISKVESLAGMFLRIGPASDPKFPAFNQNISNWDTSAVKLMNGMFFNNKSFNQEIGGWDVHKVTDMHNMFTFSSFNQDISNWDVSSVTDMEGMFLGSPFNHDIGIWDVGNVITMGAMFYGSPFNQDISGWDVSNVISMDNMFNSAVAFNQPIGSWDTSNVKIMSQMFSSARSFNQDLSDWDTEKVEYCEEFALNATSWTLPKPNFTNCDPN